MKNYFNNFIEKIKQIWSIEELRTRIILTLILVLVYRIGSYVLLPGIDSTQMNSASGIFGLIDIFVGGAFSRASILALGIMPYISASIVMQLLGIALPSIQKLQMEGESGRRKINQWTRLLTIGITMIQGPSYLAAYVPSNAIIENSTLWWTSSIFLLTVGTLFAMWIGEKITDKGLGNGISLLIMIGIIAKLPSSIIQEFFGRLNNGGVLMFLIEIIFLFIVTVVTILLVQGTRRIPIQTTKRVVEARGNQKGIAGGTRNYIPLKVNSAGVMPIIFGQAIMFLPALLFPNSSAFTNIYGLWYNLIFFLLIIIFTYFYTAITINPQRISDDLARSGSFVPGIKPGKNTSDYVDSILSRITLPGSIFLGLVAILPVFVQNFGMKQQFALFYGGTSLLILVGVMLDTLQQVETYLINKKYDGLMKTGRIKGRSGGAFISGGNTF